jgi:hypothetical protein
MVIDQVNAQSRRKLGRVQVAVLKALLERGSYPGGWLWNNQSGTVKILESLHKRGLVETQLVDVTDWRGNSDPCVPKQTFYRPVQWMLDAMNASSKEEAKKLLESVGA